MLRRGRFPNNRPFDLSVLGESGGPSRVGVKSVRT